MSRKCSVTLSVIAAFVLLPHQQPFHATPLLYGTLWLWWAAPLLMPAALLCVGVQLFIGGRPCRLRRLSAGAPALVLAYTWYFGLAEHGFLDRVWWEETGFLKLCYDWCGGGPWVARPAPFDAVGRGRRGTANGCPQLLMDMILARSTAFRTYKGVRASLGLNRKR